LPKRNPIFSPEIVTFPRALQENTQPPNVDNWDCWSKIWLAGFLSPLTAINRQIACFFFFFCYEHVVVATTAAQPRSMACSSYAGWGRGRR
jgi:hypothetical protein